MNNGDIDRILSSLSDIELGAATRAALRDLQTIHGPNRFNASTLFLARLHGDWQAVIFERNDKLSPCPFCGGPAELANKGAMGHKARCTSCDAERSCRATPTEAIEAWNKRAT